MQCEDQICHWDINDVSAQRVHRHIGEMITLDCQPFSIVEDEGFAHLVKELETRYTRALKDVSLPDLGCFAHTLQLAVHDVVLSQRL